MTFNIAMVIDKVGQIQPDLGSRIPCPCAIPTLPYRLVATGPAPSCPALMVEVKISLCPFSSLAPPLGGGRVREKLPSYLYQNLRNLR